MKLGKGICELFWTGKDGNFLIAQAALDGVFWHGMAWHGMVWHSMVADVLYIYGKHSISACINV